MADEAYLFRMEPIDGTPAYLWSGVGDLDVPGDALVGFGVTRYKGIGTLSGIPVLQNLINGTADRAEFTLSGVDLIALKYASDDKNEVRGALVRIGSWDYENPVDWEWEGRADTVNVDTQGQPNGGRVRSITISVGTATVARSTVGLTTFTDADQRKRSPDDAYFTYVASLSSEVSRPFGPK